MLEMRTSERRSLKTCAQQWYWSTVEGLAPVRPANPLWFGQGVHEGLAQWYQKGSKRGPHPAETFDKFLEGERSMIIQTGEEETEKEYVDARTLGIDMLTRYVEQYGEDDQWDVIATERTFQVRLARPGITLFGNEFPEVKNWLRYVGTWDGVYRDRATGEIWLMEHKTAASIRVDHLPLDDQAGSYWAVATPILRKAGILGPKEELAGIMYNFLRKAPRDERPKNADGLYTNKPLKQHYLDALIPEYAEPEDDVVKRLSKLKIEELQALSEHHGIPVLGEVSKVQPGTFFERFPVYRSRAERHTMLRRIQEEAIFAEAYREGWLPVTKSPSKDCAWCPFGKGLCQTHESGDMKSVEEFKEAQFIHRNPYEDHVRKSA